MIHTRIYQFSCLLKLAICIFCCVQFSFKSFAGESASPSGVTVSKLHTVTDRSTVTPKKTQSTTTSVAPSLKKEVDLFIWAGQSNAQGWAGDAAYYPQSNIAIDDSIGLYYTFVGTSNSGGNWIKMQPQTGRFTTGHFGPEVSFARKLKFAGYNPVIFKHTIGATSIYKDWKTPGKGGIFDQMGVEFRKAVSLLSNQGYSVTIRAFVWIQGESDAENDEMANAYSENLRSIVHNVRTNLAMNPSLPVILGVDEQHQWVQQRPIIVKAHQQVAQEEKNAVFTSMYGLAKADATHLTPAGLVSHGERLYSEYINLIQRIKNTSAGWVKLNDDSNSIYYSKNWSTQTDINHSGATYSGSSTIGATSTFFFNGTKAQLFVTTGPDGGKADIYIDNIFNTTIDTYSSSLQTDVKIFETPELTDDAHSIKVEVSNSKNVASTSNRIVIDGYSFYHNDIIIKNGKGTFINSPAARWQEALVGANGLLGVMDFCDPANNKLIINHAMLAEPDGGPQAVPDISAVIEQCKNDNLAGNYLAAANRSYNAAVAKGCTGYNTQAHHPGYYIKMTQTTSGTTSEYKASLNYETGEIITRWKDNNGKWERKTFVSRADNLIVTLLSKSDKGQTINCKFEPDPNLPKVPAAMTFEKIVTADYINLRAKYNHPKQNAGYEGVTRIIANGGTKSVNGNTVTVSNSSSVVLLTRMDRYKDDYTKWMNQPLQLQLSTSITNYDTLLSRHLAVYTPLFNRVELDLNGTLNDKSLSSEDLLKKEEADASKINNALLERMFYNGLYLYITNSGYGSPRLSTINLGAWGAAWSGDWTTDANTNLQVSCGNMLRQPESMEAYFNFFEKQFDDWKVNARNLLGCRGIMAPVRTDGEDGLHTHFFNGWPINFWTSGADWLLLPFCEYYETTGDEVFLKKRLYPWLKELGHFYVDFLNKTDINGKKIFALSWSPENTPLGSNTQSSINATMDIAASRHALSLLIKYSNQLGLAQDSVPIWTSLLNTLPPYLTGSDGALKEWAWTGLENSYNHRHISHLYPVFGTQEINKSDTPELFEASKKALDLAGIEDGSAFGYGQRILSETKLHRPARAYNYLRSLMKNHFIYPKSLMTSHYNIYQSDIYCSDMACGLPTMITNMLHSSRPGWIELLPALPRELPQGRISGIKGLNRVLVTELSWDYNTQNIGCILVSDIDQDINLHVPNGIRIISSSAPLLPSSYGENHRIIKLKQGEPTSVTITFDLQTTAQFPDPFDYYRIENRNSGKVLEVLNGSKEESALVIQADAVDSLYRQHWQMADVGNGYYNIVNRNSGKCLEKNGHNGNIDQYSIWNGSQNEHWQLINLDNEFYKIKLRSTGNILEVINGSKLNGALLKDVADHSDFRAQWKFTSISSLLNSNPTSSNNQCRVYPNPAFGEFHIMTPQHIDTLIQLYNMQGKKILSRITSTGSCTINPHDYEMKGIYIVLLSSSNYHEAIRMIIN